MINLHNVIHHYKTEQIHFNFKIKRGEKVAILGASGAGKSTLLNLIAGFLIPENGQIILNTDNHTKTPPAERPVSILFQENNLFAHLTVKQNIGLGINTSMRFSQPENTIIESIAHQVGLNPYLNRVPIELSGGQRQRVAIARCLIRQRPILLLDEPFSALDNELRHEMLQLVLKVCVEQQLTLMMVSHNISDAHMIAERALIINSGEIQYDGLTCNLSYDKLMLKEPENHNQFCLLEH